MSQITTGWASRIDQEHPLPEYPRPQLQRETWINLNGWYDYAVTGREAKWVDQYEGRILVPFCIESERSGVCRELLPSQRLWYRRAFELTEQFLGKRVILHFGAVDWQCKVWVNHNLAGTHSGGYCPFSIDITDYLNARDNELVVCVYDPTDEGWQQRGKQVLTPKGFWYTATSGIWQTVWMEAVDAVYVKELKLTPDLDRSGIRIETLLSNSQAQLCLHIWDEETEILSREIGCDEWAEIPLAKTWSPESPFLYTVSLEVFVDGQCRDTVSSYFGMRKISVGKDKDGLPRIFLNNEPYFQRGLLDQGYWPESLLTPPTDESMVYDIQTAKRLGFNMLRKHIKMEPARWYYHCDRLGMLVWQDMMSGGAYIGNVLAGVLPNLRIKLKDNKYSRFNRDELKWRKDYLRELSEMIDSLRHFPSICCWVPFNEGWGQFDAAQTAQLVKKQDPTRLVDHASGWYDQKAGDFNSIHRYVIPVHLPRLDQRVLVLSEFGGYSRIVPGHVWDEENSFGYKIYPDKATLTKAYQDLIEKEILPLIPRGLSAIVYTQVSDVEREVNGLMTYDRELVKLDEAAVIRLNQKMTY